MRRVERKRARRHLRNADAAVRARHPARKQPVAALERVDDDDVVGELQGEVERFGQAALDARLDDQAIDEHVDRVVLAAVELDLLVERDEAAVDPRAREAAGPERRQLTLELAFTPADDRRHHVDAFVGRIDHHHVGDALERLRRDLAVAVRAMRRPDVGEQQAKVVVDFGDRADGRSGIRRGRFLLDRDGGRQAVDEVDVRLLHLLEKLARVGRERLDVAALPLGVDGVEGQRGLPGAGQTGNHDQPIARQVDIDVAEVVDPRAPNGNPVVSHGRTGRPDRGHANRSF